MDKLLIVAIILLCLPVLTIWAMAVAARLRGPQAPPKASHEPVDHLVTDVLPYDEHRDQPAHARAQAHHANRPHF